MTPHRSLPDLAAVAAELRRAAGWIESVGQDVLLAIEPAPEHRPGSTTSKPLVSQPTEAAALSHLNGGWLMPAQRDLIHRISALQSDAVDLTNKLALLHGKLPWRSAAWGGTCSTGPCPDRVDPGRAGYCEACSRYLRRHPEAHRVPTEVIDERLRRRALKSDVNHTLES